MTNKLFKKEKTGVNFYESKIINIPRKSMVNGPNYKSQYQHKIQMNVNYKLYI